MAVLAEDVLSENIVTELVRSGILEDSARSMGELRNLFLLVLRRGTTVEDVVFIR